MTKIAFLFTLLSTTLVYLLPAAPAQAAGAARTFVSAAGSDSNNCANVATPCRHLSTAFAATAVDGEIYVLDPANYGSLTITHGVSIEGHGWASIAPVANGNAITVNANPGEKINIIGVVLDGAAVASTNGIAFNSGGRLTVRDSVIRNFSFSGILFAPNSSTLCQLFVSNTLVSDNGENGIFIEPAGSGTTNGVLDHVELENNQQSGVVAITSTQTINVSFSDSVSANNGTTGLVAESTGGTTVNVMVSNSTLANNAGNGLFAQGTNATIRVTRSTITGNNAGWQIVVSGVVSSYADNNIDGNAAVNTEPPSPLTYK